MNQATETINETHTEDAEAKLAFAEVEFEKLEGKAKGLEHEAEQKAKGFEREPTTDAFAAMKVADQLAKNARAAADDFSKNAVYPLQEAATAQRGARRHVEIEPRMDVRTMVAPLADRIGTLLAEFAQKLDAEMAEFSQALSDRNQLVREADALAHRFGGKPGHFTYQHLTVARALSEYVQPEISKRLGAIRFDTHCNRGCLLRHVAPGGTSTAAIELQLRLDASALPFRAV